MARIKSTSGTKATRANAGADTTINKEQAGNGNAVGVPATTVAATATAAPAPAATQVSAVPEPRKFEVMKTDSRKNLLPINLEDEIRRRAYELYQQRGNSAGGSIAPRSAATTPQAACSLHPSVVRA